MLESIALALADLTLSYLRLYEKLKTEFRMSIAPDISLPIDRLFLNRMNEKLNGTRINCLGGNYANHYTISHKIKDTQLNECDKNS